MDSKKTSETNMTHIIEEGMRIIPAGNFLMGSQGWGEYESPVHEVFLDDYLIDESPVTNKQFNKFVEETGFISDAEHHGFTFGYENGVYTKVIGLNWKKYSTIDRGDHPVVLVTWNDAAEYCKWAGKRLPSEAEWEKAARGGLTGKLYPWGDETPSNDLCNFGKTTLNFPQTTKVGLYPPNGYGLYDMCGNVWNWCQDWFSGSYYRTSGINSPIGPKIGETKVRRGASFNIIQVFRLRTSNRGAYNPNNSAINIGFRCVKDLK
jgi:formylglycine-generating enzyme required for sulfatase activity